MADFTCMEESTWRAKVMHMAGSFDETSGAKSQITVPVYVFWLAHGLLSLYKVSIPTISTS